MNISMWTAWLMELTPEQAVRTFVREGWRYGELSSEHGWALLDRGDPVKVGEAFRRFADGEGFHIPQGHFYLSVDIVQPDATERARMLDDMKRWCDLFCAVGIEAGVLHAGGKTARQAGWEPERIFAANVEALQAILRFIGDGPTVICLENGGSGRHLDLVQAVGSEKVGVCLDTGHLNLGHGDRNPAAFVREVGEHLKALHIADNRGEYDDHMFPYGHGCTVEWDGFVDALREVNYTGLFNYEVPGERGSNPLEVRLAKLAYARKLAEAMGVT